MNKQKHDENREGVSDCQNRLSVSFTPGPWKADGYHVRQGGQRGTRMIADVCYTGPHHTPPEEYPKGCRIADEANAKLIALAPEMLAALERIRDHQGRFGEDDPQSIAADILAKIYPATVEAQYTGHVPCKKCGRSHWMHGPCPPSVEPLAPDPELP